MMILVAVLLHTVSGVLTVSTWDNAGTLALQASLNDVDHTLHRTYSEENMTSPLNISVYKHLNKIKLTLEYENTVHSDKLP